MTPISLIYNYILCRFISAGDMYLFALTTTTSFVRSYHFSNFKST